MDFALSGFAALMAAAPLSQTDALAWGPAAAGLLLTAGLLLVAVLVFARPKPLRRA